MKAANGNWRSSGFALVDLAATLVVTVFIVGFLVIGGSETRRQASPGRCIQQLRQTGVATGAYEADNAGLIWTFSWRAGDSLSQWADLNSATDDVTAAANQAVDILRRRVDPLFPRIRNLIPHPRFNHLVLADYFDWQLPNETAACPEDEVLRCTQANWEDFCSCDPRPPCEGTTRPWAFSSSYEIGPTFYVSDEGIAQYPSHHDLYWILSGAEYGGKRLADTRYPSKKAMVWETTARHFGNKPIFFAYEEARLPILMADGSSGVRGTAQANKGWRPLTPDSKAHTVFMYEPREWEAPTLSGETRDMVVGYYRWTRQGLNGRDFGGPEVWE